MVVSIGDRPFYKINKPYIQHYAKKTNSTLVTYEFPDYNSIPSQDIRQISWYNPNSKDKQKFRLRMMKMVYLARTLQQYDRVLLLDDSCFVMPSTPNVFPLVPPNTIGVAKDLGLLGSARGYNTVNTGVMLVSKQQLPYFLDPKKMWQDTQRAQERGEFGWVGVDQSMVNYYIHLGKLVPTLLDPKFNVVTSLINDKLIENRGAWVYHLTGTHESIKLARATKLRELNPIS